MGYVLNTYIVQDLFIYGIRWFCIKIKLKQKTNDNNMYLY